jgi:hypothetical protein
MEKGQKCQERGLNTRPSEGSMSFSLLLSQLSYPGDEGKARHKYIIM